MASRSLRWRGGSRPCRRGSATARQTRWGRWTGAAVPAEAGEPFAALARRLASVRTWIFHGEAAPVVPVEQSRRAAKAFEAAGAADVRYAELSGVGHNAWDPAYASPGFIDWLFAQRRAAKSR